MTGNVDDHNAEQDHAADQPGRGLSPSHIRTQPGAGCLLTAAAVVHDQGTLAVARREQVIKNCLKCGRPFRTLVRRSEDKLVCRSCETVRKECKNCGCSWNGERWPKDAEGYPVKEHCPDCGVEYRGSKRREVTRFSENSRRRLMRLLATVKKSVLPCFVTLTFPDSWDGHEDPEAWKVVLKRFEARFRRQFPAGSYIWRQEVVDRKSGDRLGELSPHFHLLVFGVKYVDLRGWVPGAWYECVATGDEKHLRAGTQVARIKSRRGIMRYASKTVGAVMSAELGKTVQTTAGRVGRWWGVALRDAFTRFLSTVQEIELEEAEAVRLVRALRRLARVKGRDYSSLTAFIDGEFLLRILPKLAVPSPGRFWYWSTGRRWDVPFLVFAYQGGLLGQVKE